MYKISKGFVFGTFVLIVLALIWTLKLGIDDGELKLSPLSIVIAFLALHWVFYIIGLSSNNNVKRISYLPAVIPGLITAFMFYLWIKQKSYLGCPDTADFCEDYTSPLLLTSALVTFSSITYSSIFILTLRPIIDKNLLTLDGLNKTPVLKPKTDAKYNDPVKKTNATPSNNFKIYITTIGIVLLGGMVSFGLTYFSYALIDALLRWMHVMIPSWILMLIFATGLSVLFIYIQKLTWYAPIKTSTVIAPLFLWIALFSSVGQTMAYAWYGLLGMSLTVILFLCYGYFTKKPWFYYLSVILCILLGASLFN